MATFIKFNSFLLGIARGVHQLHSTGHDIKLYLSDSTPDSVLHMTKADIPEIAPGNGYDGPISIGNAISESDGVVSFSGGQAVTIMADGGDIGPFRYYVLYNDSVTTPVSDPLICAWDRGESITLHDDQFVELPLDGTLMEIS